MSRVDVRAHLPERVEDLDHPDHYSGTHRIAGLSDGVMAIAMTLLSLHLIEDLPEHRLGFDEFVHHYGILLVAYAMSFIILGVYWVGQAIQFHYVVRADRPLMVRTVIFLFFVSLVPFSTGYLGRFPFDRVAIGLYCLNLVLCGMALLLTLLHATKDELMMHRVMDKRIFRALRAIYTIGPALYTLAFAASFVDTRIAFAACVATPVLSFFPNPFWGRIYARIVGNRAAAEEEEAHEREARKDA